MEDAGMELVNVGHMLRKRNDPVLSPDEVQRLQQFKQTFLTKKQSLVEALQVLTSPDADELWTTCCKRIEKMDLEESSTLLFYSVISAVLIEFLEGIEQGQTNKTPASCFKLASFLHGKLFELGNSKEIQKSICKVCEIWWLADLDRKEDLVPHCLPTILIFSLDEDSKKGNIKQVSNLRSMLNVLDLDDDSSVSLKHLLLRCFISPQYLVMDEGIRFLAHVALMSQDFVSDIHTTVKTQFSLDMKTNLISTYASLYFRVWKGAKTISNEFVETVEVVMIQDIMNAAVHVADPRLADSLLVFLNRSFHDNKTTKGVDCMLLRRYNPIIWRSLNAANPRVRYNAMKVLGSVFPLVDPDASVVASDELLQKQFTALESMLHDDCPDVRVAAVQGASRMLSLYWEVIPRRAMAALISVLVGELLQDSTSPRVREAVLNGLEFISENPLSQNVLKDVLVHVSPYIHDSSKIVRNALVNLLIRIKSIRDIKFYDLVPVEHLLERLAVDRSLGSKLTLLLLDSFYPQNIPGSEQLRRALTLVESHPRAAGVFFANIHNHVSTGSVCKLAMLFGKWIISQLPGLEKENTMHLFRSAMTTISVLWSSVAKSLSIPQNKEAKQIMLGSFDFETFVKPILLAESKFGHKEKLGLPQLIEIVGQLPCDKRFLSDIVKEVSNFSEIPEINNVQQWEDIANTLGPAIRCLGFWKKESVLVDAVAATLTDKKKKTGKTKKPMLEFVALWCLQYMLANNDSNMRERILKSASLTEIVQALDTRKTDLFALETLLKIQVHIAYSNSSGTLLDEDAAGDTMNPTIPEPFEDMIEWSKSVLSLTEKTTNKKRKNKSDNEHVVPLILTAFSDCVALKLCSHKALTSLMPLVNQNENKKLLERCASMIST